MHTDVVDDEQPGFYVVVLFVALVFVGIFVAVALWAGFLFLMFDFT